MLIVENGTTQKRGKNIQKKELFKIVQEENLMSEKFLICIQFHMKVEFVGKRGTNAAWSS